MPDVLSNSDIWTWFNEPIAFRYGNYTYHSIYNDTGVIGVGRYDHVKQIYEVGNPRGASAAPIALDDHNNPAVLRLASGKILCCYSEHNGISWASVTSASDGGVMGTWTQTALATGSGSYINSYAHLCQTTDDLATIWWFSRFGSSGASPFSLRTNQNDGAGASWASNANVIPLIANGGQRPYCRIAVTGRRIDILYGDGNPTPAEASTNSLYHVYLVVNQAGTQFGIYKSDGTLIDTWAITGGTGTVNSVTLPITVTDGTKIYDGATSRSWIWDAQYVAGTLYATYVTFSQTTVADDTHRYWRATYSGTSWSTETICYAGDSLTPGTVGRVPQWIPPDASPGSNTIYSPGVCLDPSTADRVYVGKKYGNADIRMQQWDKSGGTWSKTTDLTGASGNSRINARPFPILGSSGKVVWWSATAYPNYNSFTTTTPGSNDTFTLARTTKISSPVYTSSAAPPGVKAMYLMHEGTGGNGATVADITGTYNGTIVGTPTWGTDAYGAVLSGWSTSNYVQIDALAASGFFDSTAYPKWIHILYRSTSSATVQYMAGFGNSGSNNQMMSVNVNNASDGQVGGLYRDNASGSNVLIGTKTRDANYHTLTLVAESATVTRLFSDGQSLLLGTNTIGTTTLNKGAIGALSRTSVGTPATGAFISYFAAGSGALPCPIHLHLDSINGQFLGTWALSNSLSLTASAGSFAATFQAANLKLARRLTASAGSFAATFQAATLTFSGTPIPGGARRHYWIPRRRR